MTQYVWPENVFAHNPAFLITIDTEGDNLWQKHDSITAENARYLPHFQQLCERYGFKPVCLTNCEMAIGPFYIEFVKDVVARGAVEIGMHLHAWNGPPTEPLTIDDWRHKPYLIECSGAAMREKVDHTAHLLEDTFQAKMVSHCARRWAFGERYTRLLMGHGYQMDCSVTPRVNWKAAKGTSQSDGGTDYRRFPRHVCFLDENDVSREGHSPLLEVPMSIQYKHSTWMNSLKQSYDRLRGKVRSPSVHWLRSIGDNMETMKKVVEQALTQGNDYVRCILHSSEYMSGGNPTFQNEQDIERLYADLEASFSWLAPQVKDIALAEYYQRRITQR